MKIWTNWGTTSSGILAIVTAITGFVFAVKSHQITPEIIATCVSGLLAGVGLIFAKDYNVTGGNVKQKL